MKWIDLPLTTTDDQFERGIEALSRSLYSPSALPRYEMMRGMLVWADEAPAHPRDYAPALCLHGDLGIYRTSLIIGRPEEVLLSLWERARERLPHWPGFRPERCEPSLIAEMRRLKMPV